MKPHLKIQRIWSDDDIEELFIEVSDGRSVFCNEVYVALGQVKELVEALMVFREQVHGGLFDIKLGEFGVEYANGGFHARFQFKEPGSLFISTYQQTEFQEFPNNRVASEARFYLSTEPVLLDNFISELKAMNSGNNEEAT
ncbi:MAG: hypothetical protein ACWA5R_14760, partial [bacterium]